MRKILNIVFIVFVCLFLFCNNVKATEMMSDFEYYNISYDFLNSKEYYVTYTFKPNENNPIKDYYFYDDDVYLDTIETNVEIYELKKTIIDNRADIKLTLDENREYYLKYKGFFANGKNGMEIKTLSKLPKKNYFDEDNYVSVYSFELDIYHPEMIELNKDKIIGMDNLVLNNEGESFQFYGGDKYEKNKYYRVSIYKTLITKSEVDRSKIIKKIVDAILLCIIVLVCVVFSWVRTKNKAIEINKNNNM